MLYLFGWFEFSVSVGCQIVEQLLENTKVLCTTKAFLSALSVQFSVLSNSCFLGGGGGGEEANEL